MRTVYRFKLFPSTRQVETLLDWRPKVRAFINYCLAERMHNYEQNRTEGAFCDLKTKGESYPLTCCVNQSTSLGYPWKLDNEKLRRGKNKTEPRNPRRSAYEMQSAYLTEMKKMRPWYKSVCADVLQQALLNLDTAFQNFFKKKSKYPRFKRTTDINFEFKPNTLRVKGNRIVFPVLGAMRFFKSRPIPESWDVKTCTISFEADGFYASILLEDKTVPNFFPKKEEELETVLGVDVGINKIASLSNGETVINPRFFKKSERRLAIRQCSVSRKKKGSKNRANAANQVARVHQRIRRQRTDSGWKLAKKIAESADVIAFEDLNIKAMTKRCKPKVDVVTGKYLKNGAIAKAGLNKAIADASWYSLRIKTQYLASKLGNIVVVVDPRYTSQQCSACGYISPSNRNKEKFLCESCGHHADADVDGAVVIAQRAVQNLGIVSLRVVSPKVMPVPELTETHLKDISLPLGGEPGNLVKGEKTQLNQLSLFDYLDGGWETG